MPRIQTVNRRKRGFLTFAIGGDDHVRRAYMLALSISSSQKDVAHTTICIGPNDRVPNKYLGAFDNVLEIPYPSGPRWTVSDEWNSIHVSPYEKTIKLDNDMMLMQDISSWWGLLENEDICFATDESLPDSYEHKVFFERNRLPILNTSFQYFNRSRFTFGVFHYLSGLGRCWKEISTACMIDPPTYPDLRILWSVTMKLMDPHNTRKIPTRVPRVCSINVNHASTTFLHNMAERAPIHYGRSNTPSIEEFREYLSAGSFHV